MESKELQRGIIYLNWLLYNLPFTELSHLVYDNPHPSYLQEKYDDFTKNPFKWFIYLDSDKQLALIETAIKKYHKGA